MLRILYNYDVIYQFYIVVVLIYLRLSFLPRFEWMWMLDTARMMVIFPRVGKQSCILTITFCIFAENPDAVNAAISSFMSLIHNPK